MWYKIDIKKLGILHLFTFLRLPLWKELVSVYLHPLSNLYDRWFQFRKDNLYNLAHNGQVCYLRGALNDTLDFQERRIYIGNGNEYQREYIYTIGEQKPKYLGKLYLNPSDSFQDTGIDFIVYVPQIIIEQEIYRLRALIKMYKYGGMRYKIIAI